MRKPSLYVLLGNSWTVKPNSGDAINELRLYSILSDHFDVYYNNDAFSLERSEIGDTEHLGPTRDYDWHYIRNNREVFLTIKGRKMALAYPYDADVFNSADALVVFTSSWKSHLLGKQADSASKINFVYDGATPVRVPPIINVGQSIDPIFLRQSVNPAPVNIFRCRSTNGVTFGFYGNLSKQFFPNVAFGAVLDVAQRNEDAQPIVTLAGRYRRGTSDPLPGHSIYLGNLPLTDMPALVQATDCILTNESDLNHCLGSQKVVDAIAGQVPVACPRKDVFMEQLGDDYQGYYDADCATDLVMEITANATFRRTLSTAVASRQALYNRKAASEKIGRELEQIL